jgi:hypothetical protein
LMSQQQKSEKNKDREKEKKGGCLPREGGISYRTAKGTTSAASSSVVFGWLDRAMPESTTSSEAHPSPSTSEVGPPPGASSNSSSGSNVDEIERAAEEGAPNECVAVVVDPRDGPLLPAEGANNTEASSSSQPLECVICLGELEADGEPIRTLVCGHAFHTPCIAEWLSKDGRCPTCRRQIQEVRRPTAVPTVTLPNRVHPQSAGAAHALLTLESRRLMMFATMEAALSVRARAAPHDYVRPQ